MFGGMEGRFETGGVVTLDRPAIGEARGIEMREDLAGFADRGVQLFKE